jgi:DNA primase
VAHQAEAGFKAESYFCSHPDIKISQLATRLAIDRHQLGGRFMLQPQEGSLRQRVTHLLLDYRLNIVETRLKSIQQQLRQVGNDMANIRELMAQYQETQEIRNAIARRLGNDIVI